MNGRLLYRVCAVAATLLFGALFAMLCIHNRYVIDDWDYLGSIPEMGVTGYAAYLYESWSGRWSAYTLTGMVVSWHHVPYSLALFNGFSMGALYLVLFAGVKALMRRLRGRPAGKRLVFPVAALCMALFFSSYSKGETWFWLVHTCVYLWSVIMTLVLVWALADPRPRMIHYIAGPLAALYIGGASESFAVVVIFLLCAYLVLANWRGSNPLPLTRYLTTNKKGVMMLAFLLAGFVFTMTAPGNDNRFGMLPHVAWYQTIWILVKSSVKIFLIRIPLGVPVLALFSLPWLWLGMDLRGSREARPLKQLWPGIRKAALAVALVLFACLVPTAVVMSELGPDRALAQVSFIVCFATAGLFFYLGYRARLPAFLSRWRAPAALVMCVFIVVVLFRQYPVVSAYTSAYDARWAHLQALQRSGHAGTVTLEPLPPSGYLSAGEITADTNHFSNNFLENALGLEFEVKVGD